MDLTFGVNSDTIPLNTSGRKMLERMRREPANVRFNDLYRLCEMHFGGARQSGSSHAIFKTPWQGTLESISRTSAARRRRIRFAKCFRRSTN